MFDSTKLKKGDQIMLAYNVKGGTAPPDRVVTITSNDGEKFTYSIDRVFVRGSGFVAVETAKRMGVRIRSGRAIKHSDFALNMATYTRWAGDTNGHKG